MDLSVSHVNTLIGNATLALWGSVNQSQGGDHLQI